MLRLSEQQVCAVCHLFGGEMCKCVISTSMINFCVINHTSGAHHCHIPNPFFVMWLEKHDRSANIQHTPHWGSSPSSSFCCSSGTAPRNSVKHTAAATLATAGTFADCNQMLSFSSALGKLLMLISRSGWNAAGASALAPKQGQL